MSIADGQTIKTLQMPTANGKTKGLDWLPDGNGLMYVFADSEHKNNTLWLQPLDKEVPRRIVELGDEEIEHFSLSSDGKSFAVVQGDWKHDAILIEGLR